MFLTRGQPVTYYGDEQGFIGAGGDKDARQDMFATKTKQYADEANLYGAGESGAKDRYATDSDLYLLIKELSKLRTKHPTLADGAQISRYADAGPGVFAFSRINPADGREYLVAVNNSTETKSADFDTYSAQMLYRPVYGTDTAVPSRRDGRVKVRRARHGCLGLEGRAAGRRGRRCSGAARPGSRQRRRLQRPGQDQRRRAGRSVRPGDRCLAAGRGQRVDQARHRRQRSVRGLPRRLEPAHGVAGGVPAGRQGPARPVRGGDHVRCRGDEGHRRRGPGRRGRSGDPARQRLHPGKPQLRDGVPG